MVSKKSTVLKNRPNKARPASINRAVVNSIVYTFYVSPLLFNFGTGSGYSHVREANKHKGSFLGGINNFSKGKGYKKTLPFWKGFFKMKGFIYSR
jgi:hypothetical protein